MEGKKCNKCNSVRPVNEFSKYKRSKDGLQSNCKICVKNYRKENKESLTLKAKEFYNNNKSKIQEKKRVYYKKNKEVIKLNSKKYYDEHSDEIKPKLRKYRNDNKETLNEYNKIYQKTRRLVDPLYKLKGNLRSMMCNTMKIRGYKKTSRTHEVLGCTFEEFKSHIESQWEDWMTWYNYGKYNSYEGRGWGIDYIIPLSTARTEEDIVTLNHHTNFQPLCSYNNNRVIKKDNI